MGFAKRIVGKFHNFVIMKRSIRFLPPRKRQDLQQLTALIREQVKQVEMIVLFGSYAKNKYVDYDQRVEFGTPTYYMSDYDIVILTRKPIGAVEYSLYEKIKDRFFENKNRPFHTHPQFVNYGIDDFNYALTKAHYFETEIKRDGVILYDSGTYKLARRRKLDYTEIRDRAQKYFDDKFTLALDLFENVSFDYKRGKYKLSSFHLHQSAENFLRTIPMVFILYGHKSHDLSELMNAAKKHTTDIFKAFPRDTAEEKRLFDLLQRAYIESRYNPDFEITKEDIDALIPKIEQLRDIVDKVCRERIAYYDSQSGK
ncbi:MAG: HEPN domain-containing protein [Alistipes sp.]|jgi:HEPN domain-containing protein/predicted nucleotidyltransferase|nr:HEPN domain-containing protein [Alistipes sp.]